jgi:hypothetical protein
MTCLCSWLSRGLLKFTCKTLAIRFQYMFLTCYSAISQTFDQAGAGIAARAYSSRYEGNCFLICSIRRKNS